MKRRTREREGGVVSKRVRAFVGIALISGSFGVAAARIMRDNGRIDGVFLAAFGLAVVGILMLPMEDRE